MEINSRIAALIEMGRKAKANAIKVFVSYPGARAAAEDMLTTAPLDQPSALEGLADRLATEITDELEERYGPTRFRLRVIKDSREIAVETLRLAGRAVSAPGQSIVRNASGAIVSAPNGVGDARPMDPGDLVLPDGALTGTATTAVSIHLLRMQMDFNKQLMKDYRELALGAHAPLLSQNKMLGDALEKANGQLIASAEQHREAIRQSRVLEAEAKAEERKAAAIEKAGEMLAKYLPAALARIGRKFGIVAADEETDPLLEKLVLSFKSSQMGQLQRILEPEQLTLFADVWQAMDARRGGKRKKGEKGAHPWAAALPALEKLIKSLQPPQYIALASALEPDQMAALQEIATVTKFLPAPKTEPATEAKKDDAVSGVVVKNGHANGNGKAAAS